MKRKILFSFLKYVAFALCVVVVFLFTFFFVGFPKESSPIVWGVNFSQKHSSLLGLDWKENYLAMLDELRPLRIKLIVHWDVIEPGEDFFSFRDLDWQIAEAAKRNIQILLVVGMKTPRWPECHIPPWAQVMDQKKQQWHILKMLEELAERYKNSSVIWGWQVENESFISFGECPWQDTDFLKEEVALMKLHDPARPVVISASGEWSSWVREARLGDIVATTLYQKVWIPEIGRYVSYPFPPTFYARKKYIIEKFFGTRVINGELQAEPWGGVLLYDLPIEEQMLTMDEKKFVESISFAQKTGFDEVYLWGAEWWYWMKKTQNNSFFWDEAARIIYNEPR